MSRVEKRRLGSLESLSYSPTLRRLEWVGIVVPLAFLVVYHYLMIGPGHGLFHSVWGLILLIGLLGLMIAAFSRIMFRTIVRLQRDVEDLSRVAASQNAQLRTLNEANLALSQERLVSSVLQRVVDLSRELARARYAALSMLGENGEIKAFLTSGIDQETRQAIGSLPAGKGLLGLIIQREEPLRLDNIAAHFSSAGFPPGHPHMTTFLGVPIRYKEQVVGSLYLTEKEGGIPFTLEDEEIVRLFANQAALAIHNTRLYERIQALAVETERTRLSREMHDGLAQVLGYVNTKAQAVEAFLENGDVTVAQEQVRDLSQAARKVYQDLREGILALRTQVGSGQSLPD
ncbi:MAG: GAF domain-containing protein, partial [Dehalococcoidia bacterium]